MRHFGIAKRGNDPKNCPSRKGRLPEWTRTSLGIPGPCRSGPARRPAPPRHRRSPGPGTGWSERAPATPPASPARRLPSPRLSRHAEHCAHPPHGGCWRGGAVATSSSRLHVSPPLRTVPGAQEWTQSETKQEFSKRPLGRIVSLLLNGGLNREAGKGGSAQTQPNRAETRSMP